MNDNMYSNDLHEALLKKNGTSFWKCWRSKFETIINASRLTDVLTLILLLTNLDRILLTFSPVIITIKLSH